MNTIKDFDKEKNKKKLFKFRKEILQWINEMEFINDERTFLEHLLGSHFLALSTPQLYTPTKKIIKELKAVEKTGDEIFVLIKIHKKRVATQIENMGFMENLDIKIEHNKIRIEFENYVHNFKEVKKNIFDMIKEIMKKNKLKLLLSKQ